MLKGHMFGARTMDHTHALCTRRYASGRTSSGTAAKCLGACHNRMAGADITQSDTSTLLTTLGAHFDTTSCTQMIGRVLVTREMRRTYAYEVRMLRTRGHRA